MNLVPTFFNKNYLLEISNAKENRFMKTDFLRCLFPKMNLFVLDHILFTLCNLGQQQNRIVADILSVLC